MRSNEEIKVLEFGTDNGPICPHCDTTVYLYRVYPGDEHWGNACTARCVSCHCSEMWDDVRGVEVPESAAVLRERHEARRADAMAGKPYALARTFVVRHSKPGNNLLIVAYSQAQAEGIALWQILGGPVKYIHADDPLDWAVDVLNSKPVKPVPCWECGQDIPAEECVAGWGFCQLHADCKHVIRRKGMTDVAQRVEAGF